MKVGPAILTLSLLTAFVTSCDPMTTVTYVNETHQQLAFYRQFDAANALVGAEPVASQSSFEDRIIPAAYAWLRVAATREDGQWVFDHTYTRDELERAGKRVIVSSLEPIAPPADVPVIPYLGAPTPILPPTRTAIAPGGTPTLGPGRPGTQAPP